MRKLTKQPASNAIAQLMQQRVKEGFFILACALALFLLIALVTYDTADPGWSRDTIYKDIHNSAGTTGAWIADVLLFFFGYIAALFPFLAIYAGFLLFKTNHKATRLLWLMYSVGIVLAIASLCALANILLGSSQYIPGASGGVIGSLLTAALLNKLSVAGTSLVFSTTLLVGLTLATGLSWVQIFEYIGQGCISILHRAGRGLWFAISYLWSSFKNLFAKTEPIGEINNRAEPQPITARIEKSERADPKFSVEKPIIKPKPDITSKMAIKPAKVGDSKLPALELLEAALPSDPKKHYSVAALENLSREVEERLLDFGAEVKVVAVCPGPIITRFEMTLAPGLKVSKISGLAKDLARSLSVTSVRVVEVIPGKAVVGLEIPNKHREIVRLREVLESPQYQEKDGPLNMALGKDISGVPVVVNLSQMPHLLVAGTTGSGKSVGVNAMLLSLLFKASPADLRLILIDPKMLELSIYDGIAHLLTPVVTDMNDAANALRWCVAEMERRFQLMAAVGVRNLAGLNAKIIQANIDGQPLKDPLWDANSGKPATNLEKLPYVVVIIDEFADMIMVVGKKVEELITRIAQKARAAGIHMILATQRPSVDVITGLIKANVPTRIAFQVSSRIDSRTILDQQGAEQLLGHGDMLYLAPGTGIPIRVHGAFVSDEEVHAVVHALKQSGVSPEYMEDIAAFKGGIAGIDPAQETGEQDALYDEAVAIVTETRKASISYLQRRLKIGYNRSARLIEAMEAAGVVSEMLNNGSREVLAFDASRK